MLDEQQEQNTLKQHYDLMMKNLRATRKISADSSCAKGKEKVVFVSEKKCILLMSSCFGSAQLMHIKQGTDWCLESHPHPFFFFFKSSSQAEQPPAHLNKCTGSTTKPFILLC